MISMLESLLLFIFVVIATGETSTVYLVVTSGTCNSNKLAYITSTEECEAAAIQVGWSDTTARHDGTGSSYPPGCYTRGRYAVGGNTQFNTVTTSTVQCSGTWASACLCSFIAPYCSHGDGATPNSAPCICGNKACTSFAGLFCYTLGNKCSKSVIPACTSDANTPVGGVCDCGTAECQPGFFCDAANNVCNPSPSCAITDGSAANLEACMCGNSDCTEATGLYCDVSNNICSGPPCDITDGFAANSELCECGLVTCTNDTGLFCYGPENVCADFAHPRRIGTEVGPVCPHDDGTTDNAGSVTYNVGRCKCGNKACTSNSDGQGTGMVCTAASNTCSRPQACTNTDGSAHISAACACGTVDCAGGEYCWEYHSRCAQLPSCAIADGSAVNSADCACVTIDCKGGEYCLYGTEDWLTQWGICKESSVGPLC